VGPCVPRWVRVSRDGDVSPGMRRESWDRLQVLGHGHVSWNGLCVPGWDMCPRTGRAVQTGPEPVPAAAPQQAAVPSCRVPAAPAAPALPTARGTGSCRGALPPPQGWDRALAGHERGSCPHPCRRVPGALRVLPAPPGPPHHPPVGPRLCFSSALGHRSRPCSAGRVLVSSCSPALPSHGPTDPDPDPPASQLDLRPAASPWACWIIGILGKPSHHPQPPLLAG